MQGIFSRARRYLLYAGIVVLGACFIFFRLGRGDLLSDDAHYSVRALTYVDYLSSTAQTTPLQWFSAPPWWMWLSFHDAPPLVFLIQHSVFRVFGDTALTARVPFAVAGVMTLTLLMVLAHSLYGTRVARWAGLALALNPYFIWSARIGMLEGIELMWIMAALVCFIRARSRPQYVLWWGAAMGLAFISKYTSFYLIPVFGGLWWRARASLLAAPAVRRRFIAAFAIIIIFCAPVIVYNASMWRTRGHFDVQFARLFGQDMSDWSNLDRGVGKNPLINVVHTANGLRDAMPLILLLFAAAGIVYAAREHYTKKKDHSLLLLNVIFLFLLFVFVSPTTRYLSLFTPFFALSAGLFIDRCIAGMEGLPHRRAAFIAMRISMVACGIIVAYVLIVGWNTNHSFDTRNVAPTWVLPIRTAQLGFNQLDASIARLIRNVRPPVPAITEEFKKVPFFITRQDKRMADASRPVFHDLILYDENLDWFGRFWALQRWMYTTSVPVYSFNNALRQYRLRREEYKKAGFFGAYVVLPAGENIMPAARMEYPDSGSVLRAYFSRTRQTPQAIIRDPSGQERFHIFYEPHIWDTLESLFISS